MIRVFVWMGLMSTVGPAWLGTNAALPGPMEPACAQSHMGYLSTDGLPATLEWKEPRRDERRVTVVFDHTGEPLEYSELTTSGSLASFDRVGSYRLVYIHFRTNTGVVERQFTGPDDRISVRRAVDELIDSPDVGLPSEAITLVREACTGF